jgi:hypothetical protein
MFNLQPLNLTRVLMGSRQVFFMSVPLNPQLLALKLSVTKPTIEDFQVFADGHIAVKPDFAGAGNCYPPPSVLQPQHYMGAVCLTDSAGHAVANLSPKRFETSMEARLC